MTLGGRSVVVEAADGTLVPAGAVLAAEVGDQPVVSLVAVES